MGCDVIECDRDLNVLIAVEPPLLQGRCVCWPVVMK